MAPRVRQAQRWTTEVIHALVGWAIGPPLIAINLPYRIRWDDDD